MKASECLFCGESQKLEVVVKRMTPNEGGHARMGAYVRCRTCGARGPLARTEAEYAPGESIAPEARRDLERKATVLWNRDAGFDDLPLFQFAAEAKKGAK